MVSKIMRTSNGSGCDCWSILTFLPGLKCGMKCIRAGCWCLALALFLETAG